MESSLNNPTNMYLQKKMYQILVALILVGGINWLSVGLFKTDLIRLVLPLRFARILYVFVGAASAFLLFKRDVYLPFLGETLLPDSALVERTPQNANEQVTVKTRPGGKVLYWAAEPNPNQGAEVPTWNDAYGSYQNSGVAVAGSDGVAILRIRGPPQSYKVPMKGELQPHVHFRVSNGNGFFGRVQTLFVGSGKIEGFVI
jgi:uncharacterized membrane protein YuzA (DUF378 family)